MLARQLNKFLGLLVVIGLLAGCSSAATPSGKPVPPETGAPEPSQGAYPPAASPASPQDAYPPAGENPPPDAVVTSPPYPQPGDADMPDWQPVPEDDALQRGEAFIDESQVLVLESFPPQFLLQLKGALPTPCHQLRIQIGAPDDQKRIQLEVYTVVDPNMICIQVLKEFDISVPIPNPPQGAKYTVWVNGGQVGEIQW